MKRTQIILMMARELSRAAYELARMASDPELGEIKKADLWKLHASVVRTLNRIECRD